MAEAEEPPTPSELLDQACEGLPQLWTDLFNIHRVTLLEVFGAIHDDLIMDKAVPSVSNIFNAFKFVDLTSIRVVILGQDPYLKKAEACGLSFSTGDGSWAKSLLNIKDAVHNDFEGTQELTSGNLEHWAKQGVLMLNCRLTTVAGQSLAKKHAIWEQFTNLLLKDLSTYKPDIIYLLWGRFAQERQKKCIVHKLKVFTWSHPSPMSDNRLTGAKKFKNCGHFSKTNKLLDFPISWGHVNTPDWEVELDKWKRGYQKRYKKFVKELTELLKDRLGEEDSADDSGDSPEVGEPKYINIDHIPSETYILFTDGSCRKNGRKGAVGGWSYYIRNKGSTLDKFGRTELLSSGKEACTNNRAELLAIYYGLKKIIFDGGETNQVMVVSDSKYSIGVFSKWLDNWIASGDVGKKKNQDIIKKIIKLRKIIKDCEYEAVYYHVRGHRTRPVDKIQAFYWNGNDKVDKCCQGITS